MFFHFFPCRGTDSVWSDFVGLLGHSTLGMQLSGRDASRGMQGCGGDCETHGFSRLLSDLQHGLRPGFGAVGFDWQLCSGREGSMLGDAENDISKIYWFISIYIGFKLQQIQQT